MNKDVKLIVSIGDICIAYTCLALVTCGIGCLAYKIGQTKSKIEIINILNEHLNDPAKKADSFMA